ncbi:AI-2E family transporter [Jeotgalibacillus soli]|uniref:AI-2E family transporter n=1 Tax=Jeotgalibacillus soli TaxID=889306 RepID=A0A0C2RRZ3_9BACL|nr:AI-2E family transporter [Jeotgalibacillus soli]KIL44499.1 hypothetical protein KP78_34630 [Jeotgalibacillus soli]
MGPIIKKWLYRLLLIFFSLLILWVTQLLWPVWKPLFNSVLLAAVPLLLSALFAYLLLPFVHFLIKAKCSNRLAVWIVFIVLAAFVGAFVQWGIPSLWEEWKNLAIHLPQIIAQLDGWNYQVSGWIAQLPEPVAQLFSEAMDRLVRRTEERLQGMMMEADHSIKWIVAISLVPFMTFYVLKDRERMGEAAISLIPSDKREHALAISHSLHTRLGGYIRGQLWLVLAVATVSFIALYLLDIPYALPLSGIMGLFNIIPYIGPILGALPAVFIAGTISFNLVVWVAVAAFVIQMLESHLLAPWIMGKNMDVHPLVIMILLLVGGELAGIIGLILAVPLYMVISIMIHISFSRKRLDRIDK